MVMRSTRRRRARRSGAPRRPRATRCGRRRGTGRRRRARRPGRARSAHTGVSVSTIQRPPRAGSPARRATVAGDERRAMADADLGPERRQAPSASRPAGGSPATNVPPSSAITRVSRSSRRAEHDRVGRGVDARDVARLAERDAQALAAGPPCSRRPRRARRPGSPSASRIGPALGRPAAARSAARRGSRRRARSRSPGSRACRPSRGPSPRATSRTSGFVRSPSGNRLCHSWSWRRPYRK